MEQSKFWMVARHDGGRSPVVRHATREAAETEAKRLAEKERSLFFVLEAVSQHYVEVAHVRAELG